MFLSNWYTDGGGAMFANEDTAHDVFGQPILAFYAASETVPEPSTWAMMVIDLFCSSALLPTSEAEGTG